MSLSRRFDSARFPAWSHEYHTLRSLEPHSFVQQIASLLAQKSAQNDQSSSESFGWQTLQDKN